MTGLDWSQIKTEQGTHSFVLAIATLLDLSRCGSQSALSSVDMVLQYFVVYALIQVVWEVLAHTQSTKVRI